MTQLMEKALAAVRGWPVERQEEAARLLLAIDGLGNESYIATNADLSAIDAALDEARRGIFASDDDVEKSFARFGT
jgi:hypothetical protein